MQPQCIFYERTVLKNSLLQQTQYALRQAVSLSQHGLRSLDENIVLAVLSHFLSHIYVSDLRFSRSNILSGCIQAVQSVIQSVLRAPN